MVLRASGAKLAHMDGAPTSHRQACSSINHTMPAHSTSTGPQDSPTAAIVAQKADTPPVACSLMAKLASWWRGRDRRWATGHSSDRKNHDWPRAVRKHDPVEHRHDGALLRSRDEFTQTACRDVFR